MRKGFVVLVAVLAVTRVSAECKFDKMLRVVYRNVTPDVDGTGFAGQPETTYRLGTQYGRTEEAPDLEQGIHALIAVSGPDSWMINLLTKKGQHLVDHGAPYQFHAPVFWSEGMPESLRGLEFGCELAFMNANASDPPEPTVVEGDKVLRYEMVAGEYRVALFVGLKDRKPRAVVVTQGEKVVYGLRYDSWQDGLTPDLKLFRPPEGIKLEEVK